MSSYTYLVQSLQTLDELSLEYVSFGHFTHSVSWFEFPENQAWLSNWLQQKINKKFIFHEVKTASIRRDIPSTTILVPGWQIVCGTQVMHSLLEQWNPSLHLHSVLLVLLWWTGSSKFLSERGMGFTCNTGNISIVYNVYILGQSRVIYHKVLLGSQYGWRWHFCSFVYTSWYSSTPQSLHWGSMQRIVDDMLVPA